MKIFQRLRHKYKDDSKQFSHHLAVKSWHRDGTLIDFAIDEEQFKELIHMAAQVPALDARFSVHIVVPGEPKTWKVDDVPTSMLEVQFWYYPPATIKWRIRKAWNELMDRWKVKL